MKKILSLLALVCLSCMGAWAQSAPFAFTSWDETDWTRNSSKGTNLTSNIKDGIYIQYSNKAFSGDLVVTVKHQSGNRRRYFNGVELLQDNNVVRSVYERKHDNPDGNAEYRIEGVEQGTYTIRIWASRNTDDEWADNTTKVTVNCGGTDITSGGQNIVNNGWTTGDNRIMTEGLKAVLPSIGTGLKDGQFRYHEETVSFTEACSGTATFNYTERSASGNERLDFMGFEILNEAGTQVVSCDAHYGYSGSSKVDNAYTYSIPAAGTYKVRIWLDGVRNPYSKGDIVYTYIPTYSEFNGKFVRFYNAGKYQKDQSKHYIAGATATTTENDAASIFYIDGNKMLQYSTGLYMKANTGVGDPGSNASQYSVVMGENNASAMTITAHATEANCYKISSGENRAIAYWDTRNEKIFDHNNLDDIWSHWYYEEVTSLPVNIAAGGFGTFYTPVPVRAASGVTVYTATVEEGDTPETTTITYTALENGEIPANTAVLVEGEASSTTPMTIIASTSNTVSENALIGKTYTEATPTQGEGGKFIYTLTSSGAFKYYTGANLAGFKCHLEIGKDFSGVSASNFRVVFTDGTLTGIDSAIITPASANVYDLLGRRVMNAQRGLYIVNGKKVIR